MNGTKKDNLIKSLQDIAHQVSGSDKLKAANELQLSVATIYNYLKGEVSNIPTAEAILNFLRKEVKRKEGMI